MLADRGRAVALMMIRAPTVQQDIMVERMVMDRHFSGDHRLLQLGLHKTQTTELMGFAWTSTNPILGTLIYMRPVNEVARVRFEELFTVSDDGWALRQQAAVIR